MAPAQRGAVLLQASSEQKGVLAASWLAGHHLHVLILQLQFKG
jgi:hypothetical protein